jgi:dihydropteroate synthase
VIVAELQPIGFRRLTLDWRRTYVMGVLNTTPDSFSDGGLSMGAAAVVRAQTLAENGADIVDVGGESTRPGAVPVAAAEERARIGPLLQALASPTPPFSERPCVVSIDTYKAEVADFALQSGAELVNDISGGALDPDLFPTVARHGAAVVIGHLRGSPADMAERADYDDVVLRVLEELAARIECAIEAGVARDRILVDPGIGFAKSAVHNVELLKRLREVAALGCPIVLGASRKSFLGTITGQKLDAREVATAAADAIAIINGAHVIRVHDVTLQRDAVRLADAVRYGMGVA